MAKQIENMENDSDFILLQLLSVIVYVFFRANSFEMFSKLQQKN